MPVFQWTICNVFCLGMWWRKHHANWSYCSTFWKCNFQDPSLLCFCTAFVTAVILGLAWSQRHWHWSKFHEVRRHIINLELDISHRIRDDCEVQRVTQMPHDIDGLCKFVIFCSRKDICTVLSTWKTWITSTRKSFHGIQWVAKCKGSQVCVSSECPFLKIWLATVLNVSYVEHLQTM